MVTVSVAAVLLAVFAAASGATRSTVVSNLAVESDVLSAVLTLFGFLALVLLAALVSSLIGARRKGPDDEEDQAHASRWRVAALSLLIFAFWLLLVYLIVFRARHPHAHAALLGRPLTVPGGRHVKPVPINAGVSAWTAGIIAVLVAVAFGRRRLAWLIGGRRREGAGLPHRAAALADPKPTAAEAAPRSRARQPALGDPADEPDPRRAVVLSYQRFAALMAVSGAARDESETPTEFSERVEGGILAGARAARDATRSLTSLFTLARYSDEPITLDERTEALDCLGRISSQMPSRA